MSQKLYEENNIRDIASAIREQNGTQDSYTVAQMGNAVRAIRTQPSLETLNVTENGNYLPSSGKDGFSSVSVNVESGEAVIQPLSATQNGTYNPPSGVDGYAPVTVNVSGGGGDILTGRDAPSASLGNDGDIYKRVIPIPGNVNFTEFLQATGSQYIDTGIIMTVDTDAHAIVTCTSNLSWIFGYRSTGDIGNAANALVMSQNSTTGGYMTKAWGSSNWESQWAVNGPQIKASSKTVYITSDKIAIGVKLDGATVKERGVLQTPNTHTAQSIILFGVRSASVITLAVNAIINRAVFYEKGSPIADYIPCLDGNGVACMWENIGGEYVYNDGTGDFAYGNAITPTELDPVYYLKKNGAWEVIQ